MVSEGQGKEKEGYKAEGWFWEVILGTLEDRACPLMSCKLTQALLH